MCGTTGNVTFSSANGTNRLQAFLTIRGNKGTKMISGKNTTFPTLRVIAFPISSLIETLASLLHHYYTTIKKRKQIKLYVTQCREKQT